MRRLPRVVLLFCLGLLSFLLLWTYVTQDHSGFLLPRLICPEVPPDTKRLLGQIERNLYKAHRHARSGNTRLLIDESLKLLNQILRDPPGTPQLSTPIYPITTNEVCPDYWEFPLPDTAWLQNAYRTQPCNRIPLDRLIQIVLFTETCAQARHLIDRIHVVYPKIKIHLAVAQTAESDAVCAQLLPNGSIFGAIEGASLWVQLVRRCSSKYVLVGRNMIDFTPYTDLDRLLRVMHQLRVDIVGGAVRLEPDGRWYAGCYQTNVKNFTIRIQPGHDRSALSCAYCDYLASPFLVRRDFFIRHMEHSSLTGPLMPFVDLFLRMTHPQTADQPQSGFAVACVDVIFHVVGHQSNRGLGVAETTRDRWADLVKKWTIDRIILPDQTDHRWTCDEAQIRCGSFKRGGLVMPGCCLEELSRCSKAFLNLTATHGVWTCAYSGNVVAAVKLLGAFLPWERDSDFGWDARKHALIQGPIKQQLERDYQCVLGPAEYSTQFKDDIDKCSKVTNNSCIYHPLTSSNWRLQLYGEWNTFHQDFLYGLQNPTLVNIDGMWTSTYPNPGHTQRNQYGDNLLGHIQHWMDYGEKSGWSRYSNVEVAKPLPCPHDAPRHACFAGNYLPVGNLQFQDVIV